MFANDIVNVCIIEPHTPIISGIFKVGEIGCSNECVKDLRI